MQEENTDSNSAGRTRGNISLEQAWGSALQHVRQIIRQSCSAPGFIRTSLALVLVGVMGTAFAGCSSPETQEPTNASVTSPQAQATTVSITPEALARLVSPDGEVTVDLDAETVEAPTQLSYTPLSPGEIPALPEKFTATGKAFELTTETPLLKPIKITVTLSTVDAALAAGNEANIVIQHYTGGAWTQLATEVDFEASTATAKVDSLSMFVLTVLEPDSAPTPVPAPAQAAVPTAHPEPALTPIVSSPLVATPPIGPAPLPTVAAALSPVPTPVPVPTAQPIPLPTGTPVPTATPVPAQEWLIDNVLVAGDKVTVFVRILGPAWFNVTLDGNATDETIIDGTLRADVFRNVPPGSHMVRVFTVGVPDQEDLRGLTVIRPTSTPAATPTPGGPPTATPIPRYRLYVNGIAAPAFNSLLQTDAGTVSLSQAPKSDGAYRVGTEVVLAAGSRPGFVTAWGGVDSQTGVFATVKMIADRYVSVRMVDPSQTPQTASTPFPWEIPTATPPPTAIAIPVPIPVPSATGVFISASASTATPVPTATPTPLPPGAPTLTPTPTPTPGPTFNLTTLANPLAGGTLSPAGTNSYAAGTEVAVTQSPSSGYIFSNWTGACTGSGSCVVTMNASQEVTGNFTQIFALTTSASPSAGGTVSPSGVNSYVVDTLVPVTASAASGYHFTSWSGDCSGSGSCAVTMDSAKNVTAGFALDAVPTATPTPGPTSTPTPTPTPGPSPTPTPTPTYNLTTSASPSAGGTLSPSGTTAYASGTQVTVTPIAASGYIFNSWSGACSGAGTCVVTINADATVTANFTQIFVLTTSASPSQGGTVSPSGSNGYISGAQVPVTASANAGYTFGNWSGDCTGSGSCVVTMDADRNVTAVFNAVPTPTPGPTTTSGIAFVSTRNGGNDIYVMNDDGTTVTRLTDTGDNLYPAWSPDGSKIAFTSTRDSDWEIYSMNSDGSSQTRLTSEARQDRMPTWSPDGTQIAFLSNRGEDPTANDIYVMDADGSNTTRLTDILSICVNIGNCDIWDPDWSPDGSKIVFRSAYTGNLEIHSVNADGTSLVNLTNIAGSDSGPSWSPDGTKIAFSSNRDGNSEVYVMNSDGSGQTRLTNNPAQDTAPRWSPDGSNIAFGTNRDGDWEIYTMFADGTSQVNITSNSAFDGQFDWGN